MADPILTDFFRALVIFQHNSALPEDRFVNSWCFRNDGAIGVSAVADNIKSVLEAFYMVGHDSNPSLMTYMSPSIESIEFRIYDLGEPPPRIPEIREPDATWQVSSANALPFECAVCLSFVAGRNQPRSRGRLYIGPLKESAVDHTTNIPSVGAAFQSSLVAAATNVLETTENVSWHVLSHADVDAKEVTGGWVDDAWDTVRKRGLAATSRETFGEYTS